MTGNFNATIENAQFEFYTMSIQRLHLFQVYVVHEGKKVRFHMQRKGEGEFYVTDPDKVP